MANTADSQNAHAIGRRSETARHPASPFPWARSIATVFAPFSAAFGLSFLMRSVNGQIAPDLSAEFGLGASQIGALTAIYFLSFGALQLPVGVWLDRYGPRRVQAALLISVGAGALIFASSTGFLGLTIGRALIGAGCAAAFAGSVKAIGQTFPSHRVATLNGCQALCGQLGAIAASAPALLVRDLAGGWRGLFVVLACLAAGCAILIWCVVPQQSSAPKQHEPARAALRAIYSDSSFWRLAPISAMLVATGWSLQSLWAAAWLSDIDGLSRSGVSTVLIAGATVSGVTGLLLGWLTDRIRRHGIGPDTLLGVISAAILVALVSLVLGWRIPSSLAWSILPAAGSVTVLSYASLAERFPAMTGRANGAMNFLHCVAAFGLQYLIGAVIALWPQHGGHYPIAAFRAALSVDMGLLTLALVWLVAPRSGDRGVDWMAQAILWQRIGIATACLSGIAGAGLSAVAVSATLIHPSPAIAALQPSSARFEPSPSEAELAYGLTEFIRQVRSVSSDPVVVRQHWSEALALATDRGAGLLAVYVPERIGDHTVIVSGIRVERISDRVFRVSWDEAISSHGIAEHEHWLATVTVAASWPRDPSSGRDLCGRAGRGVYVDGVMMWRGESRRGGDSR